MNNGWPVLQEGFRRGTPAQDGYKGTAPVCPFLRMDTASMTWPVMFGRYAAISIARITIPLQAKPHPDPLVQATDHNEEASFQSTWNCPCHGRVNW